MKSILFVLLLCALSAAMPQPLLAANQESPRPNNLLEESGAREPRISRSEASDIARNSFPGRVISIVPEGNRWRVRMDDNGTVFNVFVDADNGRASRSTEQD